MLNCWVPKDHFDLDKALNLFFNKASDLSLHKASDLSLNKAKDLLQRVSKNNFKVCPKWYNLLHMHGHFSAIRTT